MRQLLNPCKPYLAACILQATDLDVQGPICPRAQVRGISCQLPLFPKAFGRPRDIHRILQKRTDCSRFCAAFYAAACRSFNMLCGACLMAVTVFTLSSYWALVLVAAGCGYVATV